MTHSSPVLATQTIPLLRSLSRILLLVLAPVGGSLLGILGFFGAASLTASVVGFSVVGLLTLVVGTLALSWTGFALRGLKHPLRSSLWLTVPVTAVSMLLVAVGVFRPLPVIQAGPVPPAVHFWNLPTGSRLAYIFSKHTGLHRETPVIFLHGGPGTPGEGLPQGTSVLNADGFDVYAYDQIGAGRSSRLSDVAQYTVARQVVDLEAIRKTLGEGQVILVGRSWGASLAAAYLAAHPAQVSKVVLTSPGALWDGAYPQGSGNFTDRLKPPQLRQVEALTSTPRMIVHSVLLDINPAAAHALVSDAEADTYLRRIMVVAKDAGNCPSAAPARVHGNLPGYYVNQLTSRSATTVPDPRPILHTSRVPALIMRGECDFIDWAVTHEYRQVLPNSVLVYIRGAGHAVSSDQPTLYTRLLSDFLLGRPLPLPDYTSANPPAGPLIGVP